MPISRPTEAITEDAAFIEVALREAHLPSLLPALALITGDHALLRDELRPDPTNLLDPQGGLSPAALALGRELALDAIVRFRDRGGRVAPMPDEHGLRALMEWVTGTPLEDSYLTFFTEELAVGGVDVRTPTWRADAVAPDREFRVAIVGAGMSGIIAAHRLRQAGVPVVVLEKNADVGGTWLENTYPGCRVDVPSHLYSYTFAQRDDWPQHFSSQEVLLDYFRTCATELGVRDDIRFSTEVVDASWSDERNVWVLQVRTPEGDEELEVQALISAVGQLNRPKLPAIDGVERFAGPSFHSAEWQHGVDLAGKHVVVIGTGASGAQAIPIIAEQVASLAVYQRTPNWFAPTPDYHDLYPATEIWLMRHVPSYGNWYRFWLFWRSAEGMLPAAKVDPEWPHQDRSVSELNEMVRLVLGMYIEGEVAGDPDLLAQVMPAYPPAAKRIIRDNGAWFGALRRDNVELITDEIDEITEHGVRAGGVERAADVIIYATGFAASKFLTPMTVHGRNGIDLHDTWDGDARAYLGITVAGFPNLFCLYGPNTNIVLNSSITFFSEAEVDYIVGCVRMLLEGGHAALVPRPEVYDAYNERIDAGNRAMAWGASSVNSWYKNDKGRVTQNWPFSLIEYWQQTRVPDPADYELL